MKYEFKPGDVAMVRRGPSWTGRALYTLMGWVDQGGDPDRRQPLFDVTDARALVVLDPESDEDARRLINSLGWPGPISIDVGRRALRSLVAKSKPPEPMGLGAVVKDRDGLHWVRGDLSRIPWARAEENSIWATWADVDAVEVLSEGVQP